MDEVKRVLELLTFSERRAVAALIGYLAGANEATVVLGNLADAIGATRSVVVNAHRLLEAGGILRAQSCGMKGTHIRVLNPALHEVTL